MKKVVSRILVLAVALGVASYTLAADQGSWSGWVTETHCGEKGAKEGHG